MGVQAGVTTEAITTAVGQGGWVPEPSPSRTAPSRARCGLRPTGPCDLRREASGVPHSGARRAGLGVRGTPSPTSVAPHGSSEVREQWLCQRGQGFQLPSAPQRHTLQISPREGAPLGPWNHQACLSLPSPPSLLPVLSLQDERIQSLEQLVTILEEQKGKRLSQWLVPWHLPWAGGPWAPGLPGIRWWGWCPPTWD